MNLKNIGKVFTCKFVRTGPSSYKKSIYRAAVSQRLRNTAVEDMVSQRNKRMWFYLFISSKHASSFDEGIFIFTASWRHLFINNI